MFCIWNTYSLIWLKLTQRTICFTRSFLLFLNCDVYGTDNASFPLRCGWINCWYRPEIDTYIIWYLQSGMYDHVDYLLIKSHWRDIIFYNYIGFLIYWFSFFFSSIWRYYTSCQVRSKLIVFTAFDRSI